MSRIRSVHPGFFTDERLVACSAFARLLFLGVGVEADDKGIFEWKPLTLKMTVFPGDNVDVAALLAELEQADAIRMFDVAGRKYGAVRNFRKYQKPKTPNDIHPAPPDIREYVALKATTSETPTGDEGPFPLSGEKPRLMEEGGGKLEEENNQTPAPFTESAEGGRLFDELWKTFPQAPGSRREAAWRAFNALPASDQPKTVDAGKRWNAWHLEDCIRRGRSSEQALPFVPKLSNWLREGAWRDVDTLPVKAMPTAAQAAAVASVVYVDRNTDERLFKACEAERGKPVSVALQRFAFPVELVEKARSRCAA